MEVGASFNCSAAWIPPKAKIGGDVYIWGRLPAPASSSKVFLDTPHQVHQLPRAAVVSLHTAACTSMVGLVLEDGTACLVNVPSAVSSPSSSSSSSAAALLSPSNHALPLLVFPSLNYCKSIAIGCEHVLLMDDMGNVYSFGSGNFGVLGLGDFAPRRTQPERIPQLDMAVSIASGAFHCLCSTALGELYAWGHGGQGRLGLGTPNEGVWVPQRVADVSNAGRVFCGETHSAYVSDCDKLVYVWGSASFHRLGLGHDFCSVHVSLPVRNEVLCALGRKITAVSLGCTHSACVVHPGELYMWGDASAGKLGVELVTAAATSQALPRLVVLQGGGAEAVVSSVSCGASHTLVGLQSGQVLAFGEAAWCGVRQGGGGVARSWRDCIVDGLPDGGASSSSSSFKLPRHQAWVEEVEDVTALLVSSGVVHPEMLLPNAFTTTTTTTTTLGKPHLAQLALDILRSDSSASYTALERSVREMDALRAAVLELVVDVVPQRLFELHRAENEASAAVQHYVDSVLAESTSGGSSSSSSSSRQRRASLSSSYVAAATARVTLLFRRVQEQLLQPPPPQSKQSPAPPPPPPAAAAATARAASSHFATLLAQPQLVFDFWKADPRTNTGPLLGLCRDLYPTARDDDDDQLSHRLFHVLLDLVSRAELEQEFQLQQEQHQQRLSRLPDGHPDKEKEAVGGGVGGSEDEGLCRAFVLQRSVFTQLVRDVYHGGNAFTSSVLLLQELVGVLSGMDAAADEGGGVVSDFDFDPLVAEEQVRARELLLRQMHSAAATTTTATSSQPLQVVYLSPQLKVKTNSYDAQEARQRERERVFASSAKVRGVVQAKLDVLDRVLSLVSRLMLSSESSSSSLRRAFSLLYDNAKWTFIRTAPAKLQLGVMRSLFHAWVVPLVQAAAVAATATEAGNGRRSSRLHRVLSEDVLDVFVCAVDESFDRGGGGSSMVERFGGSNIEWFAQVDQCRARFRGGLVRGGFPFARRDDPVLSPMQLAREFYRPRALVLYPTWQSVAVARRIITGDISVNINSSSAEAARVTVNLGHALLPRCCQEVDDLERWIRRQQVLLPSAAVVHANAGFFRLKSSTAAASSSNTPDAATLQRLVDNFAQRVQCASRLAVLVGQLTELRTWLEDELIAGFKQHQLDYAVTYMNELAAAGEHQVEE